MKEPGGNGRGRVDLLEQRLQMDSLARDMAGPLLESPDDETGCAKGGQEDPDRHRPTRGRALTHGRSAPAPSSA